MTRIQHPIAAPKGYADRLARDALIDPYLFDLLGLGDDAHARRPGRMNCIKTRVCCADDGRLV